jgi:hypothetical protein
MERSVPDLSFQVESAEAQRDAASPQIAFKVRINNSEPEAIHSMALRIQVQIQPTRRRYSDAEHENLKELFGEPERWSKTLHPLLWINANINAQGFTGTGLIEVPLPCTFDFNVAMTKYIYGLESGDIPLTLLFSGTVFYARGASLQIAQIPWDKEARYRLPLQVWKEMMNSYYPNTAWICLRRDVFDKLNQFRARNGFSSWERAIEQMLVLTAEVKA